MPPPHTTKLPHQLHQLRTFVDAKVKWVRDPYLDFAVEREKDLKEAISLKNHILSTPSNSLPLSTASLLKPLLHHPLQILPQIPFPFQPIPPHSPPQSHPSCPCPPQRRVGHSHLSFSPKRGRSPPRQAPNAHWSLQIVFICDREVEMGMGLPHNYFLTLLADFPAYFQVCEVRDELAGEQVLALELVSWREELAVSELERRAWNGGVLGRKRGMRIAFPMCLTKGFELEKKVRNWVEPWQDLPYISPYENAFHLPPNSDQAEKWEVAVLHELLWLMVSKKTERDNVFCLGEYLGFGARFKKALVHHPGIFYLSNKIRTQTVVLREAYRKDFLVEKHPLMGMRYRYIHLMNKVPKR